MPQFPIRVSRRTLAIVGALLVALLASTGVLVIDDQPQTPAAPAPALTPAPAENPANPAVQGAPAAADSDELPGVSEHVEREIAKANAKVTAGTYDTSGVLAGATAEPAATKCYTAMNGGPRAISTIKLGVVHVTVSRNVPGPADGNALCSYFRQVKASPTWTVDNEGNSWENVPLDRVPWTQAWYNRVSCSIEFVGNTGRPGEGAAEWTDAQLREGARLMAGCFIKAGIKAVRGAVSAAGNVLKAGVVTHMELGIKGGGHTDPGPNFNMAAFMRYLAAAMWPTVTASISALTTAERAAAEQLLAERRTAHRHGGWAHVGAQHLRDAIAAKDALKRARARIAAAAAKTGWDHARRRARHTYITQLISG